jgi:hypothetical protein
MNGIENGKEVCREKWMSFYYSKLYLDGKKMEVIVLAAPHTQSIDYFHIYLLS